MSYFYAKAASEGVLADFRTDERLDAQVQRGEGIYELLKGMLVRHLYAEEDQQLGEEFLGAR